MLEEVASVTWHNSDANHYSVTLSHNNKCLMGKIVYVACANHMQISFTDRRHMVIYSFTPANGTVVEKSNELCLLEFGLYIQGQPF